MCTVLWLKLLILVCYYSFAFCDQNFENGDIIFNYNNTYKYNVTYTVYVNRSIEYIMEFAGDSVVYNTPARVTIASDFANKTYPLFITARQQKGVFSWQLPMLVQTPVSLEQFSNISRTLCPHNNLFASDEDNCDVSMNTPIIHLTSASPDPIEAKIVVETVRDFYIKLNSTYNLTSTPSQPKYYFFPFDQGSKLDIATQSVKRKYECKQKLDMKEQEVLSRHYEKFSFEESYGWRPKSVIIDIESDDDICAVVSIQNFSCPVFDNERDILYDGYYLTMTRRGGITLTQDMFPLGFYIVFIVKSSDVDCMDSSLNHTQIAFGDGRIKSFRFRIIQTISYMDYLIAAGLVLAFFLSFYLVAFIVILVLMRKSRYEVLQTSSVDEATSSSSEPAPSSTLRRRANIQVDDVITVTPHKDSSSSDSEPDEASSQLGDGDNEMRVSSTKLCVADLSRCRPRVLSARSKMYLFNVLTVAVFYTLPVIQLVVTYQRLLNQSGNQDLCYFNFLCAHPFLFLSDFNHVYSNLGYILLGILFLIFVWRRQREYTSRNLEQKQLGIPQHFGLLYAMGVALLSEGLLSAAYHVCPNSMNFQFDTSFMYVTSVLCMVKIYQSRHPDVNARAHATFAVLAIIIFIGLVGVLNANLYFWVLFTILHLSTCLILTLKIYYLGKHKFEVSTLSLALRRVTARPLQSVTPERAGRSLLLAIANTANWALAAYGVAQHSADFASHLLLVLMSNLFLYTSFYIVMKLIHREKILWYTWVYIVLTYTIWFSSSYFYFDTSTNWALSPARSRQSNRYCSLLGLYDSHDIWHFMSSIAMFFSFNMYLTFDDNLINSPRMEMAVF